MRFVSLFQVPVSRKGKIMKKTAKIVAILITTFALLSVYADANYNAIGAGIKQYCYVFPFLTGGDAGDCNLPIGEFIGSKPEIEKVKEANLDFQTALVLYLRNNDPRIVLPFMIDLPESKTVDPDSVPDFEKSKLPELHLRDGKSKISFVETFKRGAVIRKEEYDAIDALSLLAEKYPELFNTSLEKVKALKQNELNSKGEQLINSVKTENEKKIIQNLLLIRKITGITVQSKSQLESLKSPRKMLTEIADRKNFEALKNKISKDITGSVIGIRINGDRAILVYGIPDGLCTEIRKFAKVGNTYKLYAITDIKHTKSIDSALLNYWEKDLRNRNR